MTRINALLFAAFLLPACLEGQIKPDRTVLEAGKHQTHRLSRPTDYIDYKSMEEWVKANYTTYLVIDSLKREIQDGRETVSFMTLADDGVYDHHSLSEASDGAFVLQTTADLPPPTELEKNGIVTRDIQASKKWGGVVAATAIAASGPSCSGYACNCTLYARCLVPSLPTPMTYYSEKIKHINSQSPSIGAVTIMNISPPFGHVGVVNGLWFNWHPNYTADTFIQLNEANYRACQVTINRSGTPSSMHVVGYYRP